MSFIVFHQYCRGFDFLGYCFRPRSARDREGRFFVSFTPAISPKAQVGGPHWPSAVQSSRRSGLGRQSLGVSSGGLTGDEIGENDSVIDWGSGGWVVLLPSHDTKMYLIVDFRGAIPVLQMVKITTSGSLVEDTDAR